MFKVISLIYKTLIHSTSGTRLDFAISMIGIIISLIVSILTILFTYFSTNRQIIKSRQSTFDNNKYLELMKNMTNCFVQLGYAEIHAYNIIFILKGRVVEYAHCLKEINKLNKAGKSEPLNIDLSNTDGFKKEIFKLHEKANSRVNQMDIYCNLINLNEKTLDNKDFKGIFNLVVKLMHNYLDINSMIKKIPDLNNTHSYKKTSMGYMKETDMEGFQQLFNNFYNMYEDSIKYYNILKLVSKKLIKINDYKGDKTRNLKD